MVIIFFCSLFWSWELFLGAKFEIEPNNAFALSVRAEVHRLKENLDAALADSNRALEIEPNHAEALRIRSEVHYKNSNEREGVLDEMRVFELSKTTQVPSLKSLCKVSFFKHESRIVAAGTAFRLNPDSVRHTLVATGITPITIATMREKQNGTAVIGAKSIFDQLDSFDMERLFRAPRHRDATSNKRPAEEALHREDKTPKSGRQ